MKRVLVAVDLSDHSVNLLKEKMALMDWSAVSEVHLVHGFQLQVYADNFFFTAYPMEDQYEEVRKSVSDLLDQLTKDVFKDSSSPKVIKDCLISASPAHHVMEYAKDHKIDEMIIGTRGKHGIEGVFSSSFAEYMIRHAHCDLQIVRAK